MFYAWKNEIWAICNTSVLLIIQWVDIDTSNLFRRKYKYIQSIYGYVDFTTIQVVKICSWIKIAAVD